MFFYMLYYFETRIVFSSQQADFAELLPTVGCLLSTSTNLKISLTYRKKLKSEIL